VKEFQKSANIDKVMRRIFWLTFLGHPVCTQHMLKS